MKTIRPPTTPRPVKIECSFWRCRAVLECELGELTRVPPFRGEEEYAMKCPHCGTETRVPLKQLEVEAYDFVDEVQPPRR